MDEVKQLGTAPEVTCSRTTPWYIWKKAVVCVAAGLSFLTIHGWELPSAILEPAVALRPSNPGENKFSWHNIEASQELIYHQCYEDYQCAKLQVPMDWWRNSSQPGKNISIAIIRLPAKVPVSDSRYSGAVLTNPGGPGGSGVAQMLRSGRATQTIVDAELDPNSTSVSSEAKYHDIISFDPRGIGYTTPGIHCFPDSLARSSWELQNEAVGILGSSEDAFDRNWYRARALAESCSAATDTTGDDSEDIGEHVNTTPVARDMLEIVERHAEWLEKQAIAKTQQDQLQGIASDEHAIDRLRYTNGTAKIKYWGNSYGTIIGQTFAAMYPDRVERIVLDGVCNAPDYFFGPWFSALADADAILSSFFSHCHDAGPELCSYHSSTPEHIKQNYEILLEEIRKQPKIVLGSKSRGPDVITWSDVKSMVRLAIYQPLLYSPLVADLLIDISSGNGSLFADLKAAVTPITCPSSNCNSEDCDQDDNAEDAALAILCADAPGLGSIDKASFKEYWHTLQNQSSALGDWWAHTRLGCLGWKPLAKNRFQGPVSANTAFPMLFVGNALDPVTPFENIHPGLLLPSAQQN
ncbi:hypothetical protein E4T42_05665 [Aureobasidium subglaciale]|nr:hypothetical protein E4T42_05665 [Aureobasidium subglaciale]